MNISLTTRTRRTFARVLTLVAAGVTAGVVSLGAAAPAQAYQYAAGGYVGPVGWSTASCLDKPVWGQLQVVAKPPVVRSPNVHAGSGNDSFYVHYAAYLVDASTGVTLQHTSWSGWAIANDNRSVTWSGDTVFKAARNGNYRVDYRIEWWNSQSRIGWRAERVNKFNFYDGYQTGPYGPLSSCALIY